MQVAISYVGGFHTNLKDFLEFAGDKTYSYKKHLKPIVDLGLISPGPIGGDHNSTKSLVHDYKTDITYINFWLGSKDPN